MPMYEYSCPKCQQTWDDIVSFESRDDQKCPACDSQGERKVSAPGPASFSRTWFTQQGRVNRREMKVTYNDGQTEYHNLRDKVKDFK